MKKLFVCLVILTLLVGCKDTTNNNVKENNKDNNEIKRPEVISGYTYLDNIKCDAFKEDIKYLNYDDNYNNGWFVTDNNDAYYFSLNNKFSDETNCKKYDKKFPDVIYFEKMEDGNIRLYDKDYNLLELVFDKDTGLKVKSINLTSSKYTDSMEERLAFKRARNTSLTSNKLKNFQLVPKSYANDTKNIYAVYFYYDGYYTPDLNNETNVSASLFKKEKVFTVTDQDEVILDFYYMTNKKFDDKGFKDYDLYDTIDTIYKEDMFILTNKYYYRYGVKDDKCYEYLDVPCEYGIYIDEDLSKIRNDIVYRDARTLILNDGTVYYG